MGGGVAVLASPDDLLPREDLPPVERHQQELQRKYHRRNLAAFWILGFFNNYYYCVVLSSAESIAESYHLKTFIALVSWAEIVGGIAIRMVNGFLLAHIGYNWRCAGFALQALVGVLLVCVAPYCGDSDGFRFFLSLIGISFIGNSSSYGESAMLGFLDRMPPTTLSGWSAGTGLSGVAASLVYLGLSAVPGFSNSLIFLVNAPSIFLYCWSFYWLVVVVTREDAEQHLSASDSSSNAFRPTCLWRMPSEWGRLTCRPAAIAATTSDVTEDAAALQPEHRRGVAFDEEWHQRSAAETGTGAAIFRAIMPGVPFSVIRSTHRIIFFNCLNLMLVYVFEYGVQFIAPFAFPTQKKHHSGATPTPTPTDLFNSTTTTTVAPQHVMEYDWGTKNAFVLSQFCYQVGVLFSRSSLQCVRIRRVHILTTLQFVNFCFWLAQARWHFLWSDSDFGAQQSFTAVLLVLMVYVGLMGGASYVNVFFNILNDGALFPEDVVAGGDGAALVKLRRSRTRQLAMNIGAMYATAGITIGAALDVLLSNTFV